MLKCCVSRALERAASWKSMLARAPPLVEKLRVALREMGEKEVVIFWRYDYVLM